jgi:hypothetical protein
VTNFFGNILMQTSLRLFISTMTAVLCLAFFTISNSSFAAVTNYSACISAPLPQQPKSPNYATVVTGDRAISRQWSLNIVVWRETCTANSNQSVILMRFTPTQGIPSLFTPAVIQNGQQFPFTSFDFYSSPSSNGAQPFVPGNLFIGDILVPTTVVLQQGPFQSQLVDENAAFTLVFSGLNGPVQLSIPAKGADNQPPGPQLDYSAMWWNAAESGWGMSVIQSPTTKIIFAVIYVYDGERRPTWFVLPSGSWTSNTSYTGDLYRTDGPPFTAVPFDPRSVNVTKIGTASLTFTGASAGTLEYSLSGVRVTKSIVRQVF